jgi:hypothetical protein
MSRSDGIGGVVREALTAPLPAAPAAVQDDLFAPPVTRRPGESAEKFAERQAAALAEGKRGVGRPKGAQNLATRELKELGLRSSGGKHPFIERMRWFALGVDGIRQQLGCTYVEAFDRWERLAATLQKVYIADQAPVDDQGKAVPGIAIFTGGTGTNTDAGGLPPWRVAFETADGEIIDMPATLPADLPASPADRTPPEDPAP